MVDMLNDVRKRQGITLEQLAEKIGCSVSALTRFFAMLPTRERLTIQFSLPAALGLEVGNFWSEEDCYLTFYREKKYFSDEEKELVSAYRALDAERKERLRAFLFELSEI